VRRWLLLDGAVVCQMHAKPGWLLLGEYQPVPTINLSPAGQAGQCRHKSKLTAIARGAHTLIVPGTIVWLEESNFAKLFRRQFVARNSAFVYVGGQEIFRYDKQSDAGELFEAEQRTRSSVPAAVLVTDEFQGFDDDVSVYRVAL